MYKQRWTSLYGLYLLLKVIMHCICGNDFETRSFMYRRLLLSKCERGKLEKTNSIRRPFYRANHTCRFCTVFRVRASPKNAFGHRRTHRTSFSILMVFRIRTLWLSRYPYSAFSCTRHYSVVFLFLFFFSHLLLYLSTIQIMKRGK